MVSAFLVQLSGIICHMICVMSLTLVRWTHSWAILWMHCVQRMAQECVLMPPPNSFSKGIMSYSFIHSSSQILLPRYLTKCLNDFDTTDGEYLLALTDDLIRFWRSKIKVTADLNMWWQWHPRRCWHVIVRLLACQYILMTIVQRALLSMHRADVYKFHVELECLWVWENWVSHGCLQVCYLCDDHKTEVLNNVDVLFCCR